MTATRSLPEAPLVAQVTPGLLPRPSDGTVNLRGPLRQLAEPIASETMGAGADQTRAGGNSGSGHRERRPATCVGTPAPRVPRPGGWQFLPQGRARASPGGGPGARCHRGRDVCHGHEHPQGPRDRLKDGHRTSPRGLGGRDPRRGASTTPTRSWPVGRERHGDTRPARVEQKGEEGD